MESPLELWHRLRGGSQREELDEEIQYHIDRQTEKNIRLGMTPVEARRYAIVKFGGVERAKEAVRDESRAVIVEDFGRDLRYGLRTLLRSPGFALIAILTLGLGIGAATSVFSVVQGVLLKPLDYPEGERIVRLFQLNQPDNQTSNASEPNYLDWKAETRAFSSMAQVQRWGPQNVMGVGDPHQATVSLVSASFFDVMDVKPIRGRGFQAEELTEGAAPTALVSETYWRDRLGAPNDLRGSTIKMENRLIQVIGVMPANFGYPPGTEIWIPRELMPPQPWRTGHNWEVVARIAPGFTLESAVADISGVSRRLKQRYGEDTWMNDATALPLLQQMTKEVRPLLFILWAASLLLLLIACANVSNLQLARSAGRTRELAVRLAMGASRWRVARQLLAESFVLCFAAGVLGVVIAHWGVRGLLALEPGNLPLMDRIGVDVMVLAFAIGIALLMSIVLSLATTLRASRADLRSSMTEGQRTMSGGRASQHVRDTLVVAQVTLTLILLVGAGLLTRSFVRLMAVNPGFNTGPGLIVDVRTTYPSTPDAQRSQIAFQDELMNRVSQLPGISTVGLVNDFPLGGGGSYSSGTFIEIMTPEEIKSFDDFKKYHNSERQGEADYRVASADYFRAMGIPLLRGRVFQPSDCCGQPHVAVISKTLADREWPNQDPIGRLIQYGGMDGDLRPYTIVGVVGDLREFGPDKEPRPMFYANSRQRPVSVARYSMVIRGPQALSAGPQVSQIMREMNPELPIRMRTMDEALNKTVAGRRFSMILITVFSAAALILATLGMYGVISYLVSQRTREIGIRMALGADSGMLLRMIVGRGVKLALIGVVVGVLAALGLTRFLEGMLYGVAATDPVAFGTVIGVITGAVVLASYVPARRALGIAPVVTLRSE